MGQWLQVIILGLVEGVTEFLPISSTGHLVVTREFLRFKSSLGATFEIFIQLGAVLAVVGYYYRDLWAQAAAILGRRGPRAEPATARRLWLGVLVAFLPAAVIGLALHHWIKGTLFRPSVIASTLILGGVGFVLVELLLKRPPRARTLTELTLRQAFVVGVAQVLALVPGVSRSGASIIGGLLVGLDRPTATAFSFYLAIPTLGGATIVDLLQSLSLVTPGEGARLALGTVVSLIVAWASIGWLLRYVSHRGFIPFGIYRLLLGAVVFGLVAAGWL